MALKLEHKSSLKVIACLLALVIFAAGSPVAAEGMVLRATDLQGQAGEQVIVEITADNAAGTEGGQFILQFNPETVRPIAAEPGTLVTEASNNLHMVNLDYEPGKLMFMWVTAAGDTDNTGLVCTITFELLSDGLTNLAFDQVIVAPDGIGTGQMVPGRIAVGDTEVDRDEDSDTGLEETEGEPTEEPEETTEEDNDENLALPVDGDSSSSSPWLIAVAILAVLASAGFLLLRRNKITWSKQKQ